MAVHHSASKAYQNVTVSWITLHAMGGSGSPRWRWRAGVGNHVNWAMSEGRLPMVSGGLLLLRNTLLLRRYTLLLLRNMLLLLWYMLLLLQIGV